MGSKKGTDDFASEERVSKELVSSGRMMTLEAPFETGSFAVILKK